MVAQQPSEPAADVDDNHRGRLRRRLVLVVVLAAFAVPELAVLVIGDGAERAGSPVERAPSFALPRVGAPEETVSLADFAGRPVVVNFWASWCAPCRRERPALREISERRPDVAFVGVNHQDGRSGALELQEETGIRYPSGYDPDGGTAKAYGLVGMPATVFVSADGRILERRMGELSAGELERTVARLFGAVAGRRSGGRG